MEYQILGTTCGSCGTGTLYEGTQETPQGLVYNYKKCSSCGYCDYTPAYFVNSSVGIKE